MNIKKCKCGCGKEIDNRYNFKLNKPIEYIHGHNSKGKIRKPLSKETKKKISLALKGRKMSRESKKKMSASKMGHLTSKETRKKIGLSNSLANLGNIPWNKGIKCPQISKSKIGKKVSKETIERLKISHLGYNMPEEQKKKIRESNLKSMNSDRLRRILSRREKSSLEIKFETIISKLGLPYKFVGNGEVIVARKVPDFVDSNGKKIAIEVYYRKHKEKFRKGLEKWKAERIKIFNEKGWELFFFDETQVNENMIKQVLGELKSI